MTLRKAGILSISTALMAMLFAPGHLMTAQQPQGGTAPGMRMGGPMNMSGSNGTITEIAKDHLTIKDEDGALIRVNYSANTRVLKEREPIAVSDLKVGDTVMAAGQMEESSKTINAIFVAVMTPAQIKAMNERKASYGKTWLAGKITAINETKITLAGMNNSKPVFAVDENTSFKKDDTSATLADFQVGDNVYVEGTIKDGVFTAATLSNRPHRGAGGMVFGMPSHK